MKKYQHVSTLSLACKKTRKDIFTLYHKSLFTKHIAHTRAVVSGGAEGALAPPEFGSSVNPIPTGGGRLCPPHYC